MKRAKKLLCVLLCVFLFPTAAFAHSGRTDAHGGHRDNKNASGLGSYHYHCDGHPAHLHPDGYCPYNPPADAVAPQPQPAAETAPAAVSEPAPVVTVTINGAVCESDVPACMVEGRTLIPARAILEGLGAQVSWDADTQEVTATKENTILRLTIDEAVAWADGSAVQLDVPARILEGRTFVPARFVAEALDADVSWDAESQTVRITTGEGIPDVK